MAEEALLTMRGICKYFPGVRALENVDFTLHSGEVHALVGENGGAAITLDDFAALNGTINYEECCLIGRRVPRVYMQGGREIAAVDYVIAAVGEQTVRPL